MERHSHCSYCGRAYADDAWPRTCAGCKNTVWRNPIPVIVALVPVGNGLLGVRRDIPPKKGMLALPGGFIDYGESWQEAAARELREETGVDAPAGMFRAFDLHSTPDGSMILIFARLMRPLAELPAFTPNSEVSEIVVLKGDEPLAFPLHDSVMKEFMTGLA